MTYFMPAVAGFGDVDSWSCMSCHIWSSGDVYVFRASIAGVILKGSADLLPFIKAFGRDNNLRLDVRGAGLWKSLDGALMIDIVSTVAESGMAIPFFADNASNISSKMSQDKDLLAAAPSMKLSNPSFGVIVKPNDSIDHWLSMPIMWTGGGLPTASFAQPHEYSLFLGKADDGQKVVPWAIGIPGLGPVVPGKQTEPGLPPDENPSGANKPGSGGEGDVTAGAVTLLLMSAAFIGVAGWISFRKDRKK